MNRLMFTSFLLRVSLPETVEIAILIGSNNRLPIRKSELSDRLFSRLQLFFLVALIRLQDDPHDIMGCKHRVLDRADFDSHVPSICLHNRYVFLTGSVRRIGQQLFPAVYTAGIGFASRTETESPVCESAADQSDE